MHLRLIRHATVSVPTDCSSCDRVHLEAINHRTETRADLHQRLHRDETLHAQVTVPEDGANVPVIEVGG